MRSPLLLVGGDKAIAGACSETLLSNLALLPMASLAATTDPEHLLSQVAQQVSKIESTQQRQDLSAYVQLLAGLFDQGLTRQLFQQRIMRESVIYQEMLQDGEAKGRQEGRQEEGRSLLYAPEAVQLHAWVDPFSLVARRQC